MKDHLKPCEHESCDDAIYKDVVVIGNGPSGLVTSFLLAGNVPRLRAAPLDGDAPIDEMLQARLSCLPEGQSLLETDLGALAAGLEGRSRNPMPLLMDSLLRPGADIGAQADPLVEWTHDETKRVRHIVLGRLPPGGAWHGFGSRVRSLSPAAWLALPPHVTLPGRDGGERVPAPSYAAYCRRYVAMCKLQRYFRSGVVVTSVRPERRRGLRYRVTGYVVSTGAPVQYVCRRVVLAAGAGDRPGDRPQALPPTDQDPLDTDLTSGRGAVLVVGSGVSAADAVIASRGSGGGEGGGGDAGGRHVYHVHRRAANALAALDRGVYPDYHEVYKMMCDGPLGRHHNYTSLPDHVVLEVADADSPTGYKRVKLYDPATASIVYKTVESIAVRTGSRPDLFFLQTNFNPNNIATKCRSCHPLTPLSPRTCFLSNPWQNLKSVLGHTVQICKSRYLAAVEVNGNDDSKCTIDACNKINDDTRLISNSCCCELLDKLSDGIGFGVDPSKPVDGRSNPIAIDTTTHEVLNAPPGIYAVGPVAGDNFVRFIPGGALAAVAHIHKQMKMDDD